MPVGEIIFSVIGESIGYLFFDGIGYGLRKLYFRITGKEEDFYGLTRLKRWYLNRFVLLKNDLNELIQKGSKGKVVKILDEKSILVQFENDIGKLIFFKGKSNFKLKRTEVRLILQKRNRR
ncbi:MAG: hypothetical protein ABF242_11285 [Flavobacteriales bacterium]